jgi:2,3-bisphosphoglycerate-independent phosphoglycerate mutase
LSAQMLSVDVPGANGYIDSNLAGKTAAAIALLEECDVVIVHLNAADEEAHQRNLSGKLRALELFDEVVIGPLARHLHNRFADGHRMAFLPDHYTCVADGHHIVHPVPCAVWGTGVTPDAVGHYGETEIAACGSFDLKAWELMPLLLAERFG